MHNASEKPATLSSLRIVRYKVKVALVISQPTSMPSITNPCSAGLMTMIAKVAQIADMTPSSPARRARGLDDFPVTTAAVNSTIAATKNRENWEIRPICRQCRLNRIRSATRMKSPPRYPPISGSTLRCELSSCASNRNSISTLRASSWLSSPRETKFSSARANLTSVITLIYSCFAGRNETRREKLRIIVRPTITPPTRKSIRVRLVANNPHPGQLVSNMKVRPIAGGVPKPTLGHCFS